MTNAVHSLDEEKTGGFKDQALKLAGYGYSVGDLTMAGAAKLRGESNVMGGALIWLAGGIAAARYGHPAPDVQAQLLARRLEAHLQANGVAIPDDVRQQQALFAKPGFLQQCQEFLYRHPSEMLNAAYGIGAALLLKDGVRQLSRGEKRLLPVFADGLKKESILGAVNGISKNFWMGALIGGGALAGIAIKEDPQARKRAAESGNPFAKAAAYIQEKPLRLTGTLYGLNNIFTVLKAVEDHSRFAGTGGVLKPHHLSGVTAGTYILSNVLLTTVSRDHQQMKTLSPGVLSPLADAAARVIAAQPQDKRAELLAEMADYLAQQPEVGQTKEVLQAQLTERLAAICAQAPVGHQSWAGRMAGRAQEILQV